MKCKLKIGEEAISAYVDGEVTPAERQTLSLHFAKCPVCESTRVELAAFKSLLKEKAVEQNLPANFWMRVQASLDRADRYAPTKDSILRRPLSWTVWAPALALALVAVFAIPALKQSHTAWSPTHESYPQTLNVSQVVNGFEYHLGNNDAGSCMCMMRHDFRDSREAATWVSQQVGYSVSLPDVETAGYRVIKAGACACVAHGRSAMFICQKGDHLLAFIQFVPREGRIKFPEGQRERIDDRNATVLHKDPIELIGWQNKQGAFGVVGNQQNAPDLIQLASLPIPHGDR